MWDTILEQQFHLSYVKIGGISWEATENMSPYERKALYHLLVEQKEEEKKAMESK